MAYETLKFEREEAFVVVTLNRPPANAINEKLVTELARNTRAIQQREGKKP